MSGSPGRGKNAAGTACSGSFAKRYRRSSDAGTSPTTQATRRLPPPGSGRTSTAAARTPGCAASADSTSPGSTRKPRTLTCRSTPAEELDPAVRQEPHPVAGPIEPRPGHRPAGVGHELLRRPRRVAPVTPRQPDTAGAELAGHPDRHRPQLAVEHRRRGVRDRPPDRHRRARVGDLYRVATGESRPLGRSIAVDQPALRERPPQPRHMDRRQHVPPGQQLFDPNQILQLALDHLVEEPGGQPEHRHPRLSDLPAELGERKGSGREHHQPGPGEQSSPDLERSGVERGGRDLGDAIRPRERHIVSPQDQPRDRPVRHRHPLGNPRRARRVDQIGQLLRASLS